MGCRLHKQPSGGGAYERFDDPGPASTRARLSAQRIALAAALWCVPFLAAPEIRVAGVEGELKRNVESYLALSRQACDADPWRVRRAYGEVESEVREALEPYGHYAPVVTSELAFDDSCWVASVDVDPGPPVTWRDLEIEVTGPAGDDAAFIQVVENAPLSVGAPLRHAQWESFKNALQAKAFERGYVEAEFVAQQVDVWPEEMAADGELRFASGPRYEVGTIEYEQRILRPELLDAYLNLTPGVPFDSSEISRAYRDLSDSGYFRRVEVTPAFDRAANGRIPISVVLEPAERIEYTVGAGFATDTGPRLRGGYRNRRVNREGHRLNLDLTVSRVISGLTADYRQPIGDPRSDWMSYTAAIDVEDTDTFESEAGRVGVRRTRRMGTRWLRTLSLDFSYDRFTVADVRDRSRLLLPAVAFEYKRADADLYPNRGVRLNVELRAAHDALLSDTSLVQMVARGRWIHATSENGRLLGRATVGVTAKDDFSELPPSLRFFAGGDESIRGYDYNTLGPSDDDGEVIGGSGLLIASLEYEHRIRGNFFGAVFVDAGNAYDGDDFDPAYGTGLGVKWRSPVGPVRLYLAHPLNQVDRDVRVHISLGVDL